MRHPGTAATAAGRFPADEPAADRLGDLAGLRGPRGELLRSPAQRCAVAGALVDPALGPWDLGSWSGRELTEVAAADLASWQTDPDFSGHRGESARALADRVRAWLHAYAQRSVGDGPRTVAVTHGAWVRGAVVTALGAPPAAFWQVEIAPASVTELHVRDGRWRLVSTNVPLPGDPTVGRDNRTTPSRVGEA